MKNLFLALAFVLVGSFSFANSISTTAKSKKYAISVETSCGIDGLIIADERDSKEAIEEMALALEEFACGKEA